MSINRNRSTQTLLKEVTKAQLDLMHDRKPYMGSTKDYTLNECKVFKHFYDHHIRLGEPCNRARLIAMGEVNQLNKLSRSKRVAVKYKQGKEIIGKIFKFTHQHIALKTKPNDKPIWLDRRYISLIKTA
ncbi:hypothetical protein [Cysteiniphilum marinum]|uniref:hypothetical protein n=1 Tax=Cysteiniphilum marinum TaxID=2774191 RepID=UPI00193B1477|nr:hypothetical protein [Cysteiniphilum marinum]